MGLQGMVGEADKKEEVVHFGTYTIQDGRNGVLELALRGIVQANVDLGFL